MKDRWKNEKVDMAVDFCGIHFQNPFILASAPPTATAEMIGRAFEAGWAGAVTKTLVGDVEASWGNVSPRLANLSFPGRAKEPKRIYALENIELGSKRPFSLWLKEIEQLRKRYPAHVVIASIVDDARKPDGWRYKAKKLEEAGAQMIELNFSCPHGMKEIGLGAFVGQNADLSRRITQWVAEVVQIPVMPKMTGIAADVGIIAKACVETGARAIAAINTVGAIIGVDLETYVPKPNVTGYSTYGGLSGPAIKPIALKAVASIANAVKMPISGMGGISSWEDAAEFLLLGASTLQLCTAVMVRGFGMIDGLLDGLKNYMEHKGFKTVSNMVGLSLEKLIGHAELSREVRVSSINEELCIKCHRCYVSCQDAGAQAISLQTDGTPWADGQKCNGCSLCQQVCPVLNCVTMVTQKKA